MEIIAFNTFPNAIAKSFFPLNARFERSSLESTSNMSRIIFSLFAFISSVLFIDASLVLKLVLCIAADTVLAARDLSE